LDAAEDVRRKAECFEWHARRDFQETLPRAKVFSGRVSTAVRILRCGAARAATTCDLPATMF
jgi:hypothetical protein